jgi:hypothetical protein
LPFRQSGIWEKLLCHVCEQKLSKYEVYSSRVLRRLASVVIEEDKRSEASGLGTDVDYQRFKLFLLSLIWRAGIASKEGLDNPADLRDDFLVIAGLARVHGRQAARLPLRARLRLR